MSADVVEVWAHRPDATRASWLAPAELARADRCRHLADRARRIAGAALLRAYAASVTGQHPASVVVERSCPRCGRGDHGVPTLPDLPGTWVSLSHSGDHVLLAAAARPVGVDVETGDANGLVDPLGAGGGDPGRDWARREAVAKLTGLGLLLPIDRVVIAGADPWRARVLHPAVDPGPVVGLDLPLPAPAAVAVAGQTAPMLGWSDAPRTAQRLAQVARLAARP